MSELQKIGRLALRVEGPNWNAYYAKAESMEGAIWLGSIKMAFVQNPERKQQFMELMRECFGDTCEELFGVRPTWGGTQTAPEHERTGST